jgi:hopene-associated glycosyltransferase HpnB
MITAFSLVSFGFALFLLAVWLVLLFAWGGFWQVWRNNADDDLVTSLSAWPSVVAVVPARNESATISETVSSLARQDYPGQFSVVVVDDHSEDGTAELARRAAEAALSSRVKVIPAPPLPAGWTGKLWALNTGIEAVAGDAPEWFWFVDADVVFPPDALRRLVSRAANQHLTLASLMVLLQSSTFAERLLIPPFLYFFLMLYPPRWTSNPQARTAGAAGGCILLRREALVHIGGLTSIRGELIDDCALARAVKRSGGRLWLGLSRSSRAGRGHKSFSEIRDMIARSAFTQLRYSPVGLFGTLSDMALIFLLPVFLMFSPAPRVWPCALLAWILMCVSFTPTLAFYRLPLLLAPLLPAAAMFYAYATGLSAVRYWLGRGGQWKGRSQALRRKSSG